MKAAVYYGPGDIRVETRPDPVPEKDNLIVKVHCCAICGTDLKLATVGVPRCHPPRIVGHEFVGHLVHVGSAVEGFGAGERVTMATTIACGQCAYCALGLQNLCPDSKPISYDYDGAFAEYLNVPAQALKMGNVLKVPERVPDETAAISEPLSCAVNCQEICGVKPGAKVLIIGGGPLGAIHAELAKALGAGRVMLTEYSDVRLSFLRKLKNGLVIDAGKEDALATVKAQTDGLGADVVIVCAPTSQAQAESINYARKSGAVSFFASLPKGAADVMLDSRVIHYGELRISGASDSRPEHVGRALRLMEKGLIDSGTLVTHRVALADIHQGLDLMKNRQGLKVLVMVQS